MHIFTLGFFKESLRDRFSDFPCELCSLALNFQVHRFSWTWPLLRTCSWFSLLPTLLFHSPFPPPSPLSTPTMKFPLPEVEAKPPLLAFTLAPGPFMKAAMPTHQELRSAFDPTEWSTWRPVGEVRSCPAPTTLSWEISHKQILCYITYMCVLSVYICAYIYIYTYIYIKLYMYHSKMDVLWCDNGIVSVSFWNFFIC